MSRGSFNGPGGQHTRWMIPPTQGAALGAQHDIRNKQKLNFVTDDDLLRLNRNGLATTGIAVVDVKAREVAPGDDIAGVRVLLDGAGDTNPPCRYHTDPMCEGPWYTTATGTVTRGFNDYTVEVVQQIGSDSFTGGNGVLLGKNKTRSSSLRFVQLLRLGTSTPTRRTSTRSTTSRLTARPSRPRSATSGRPTTARSTRARTRAPSTSSRPRGTTCTSTSSTSRTDAHGVMHYKVGVRSLDGAGPQTRGVQLSTPTRGTAEGLATCTFPLKNTGVAADLPAGAHPTADAAKYFGSDIYRLSASATGTGWTALPEERARHREVRRDGPGPGLRRQGGQRVRLRLGQPARDLRERPVEVHVGHLLGRTGDTVGGTVPATLALNLGTAATSARSRPACRRTTTPPRRPP